MPWYVRLASWITDTDPYKLVWGRTVIRHQQLGDTVEDEHFWNEMPTYEFVNAMLCWPDPESEEMQIL